MKRKFSNGIKNLMIKLPMAVIITIAIVIFLLLTFLCSIPVIFDYVNASKVGKAFMIVGTVLFYAIYILSVVVVEILQKNIGPEFRKNRIQMRIFYTVMFVLSIYWSLSYFSRNIWGTRSLGFILFYLIAMVIQIYIIVGNLRHLFNNERILMLFLGSSFLLFYLGLQLPIEYWDTSITLIKIAFGIIYIELIAVFVNSILSGKTSKFAQKHKILLLIIIIFIPLAVLITLPYYIQWCGLTGKNFNTFVTVYAAIVGGGLTLMGVAWTIRQQEKIRQDEEKKKYRPIVLVRYGQIEEAKAIELKRISDDKISYTKTETLSCETYINPIVMRNTDFTPFYLYGIIVNDICLFTELKFYINRDDLFVISFEQQTIFTQKEIDSIALLTQDLLGNFYKIPMQVEKMLVDTIGKPVFKQGTPKTLKEELSQIWCRDEMQAIELENFSLKED